MTPTRMRGLIEQYVDAYNNFEIDRMLATLHPEVQFVNISGGVVNAATNGIDELRKLAESSKALFSARHQELLSFDAADDVANISVAFRAVVAGDLPNGMKKGEELMLVGKSEFHFRDGLIDQIKDIS